MRNLTLIGYANGNLGKQVLYGTVDLCLLYYLTDIIGFSPLIAGYILFLSLIFDALLDPIMGVCIEKLSKFGGNFSRYILNGTPVFVGAFVLLFWVEGLSTGVEIVLVVTLLVFRLGYTIIDVPHNAMISRLIQDSHQRTVAAAWRFFFSSTGSLVTAQALQFVLTGAPEQEKIYFQYFSLVAATIAVSSLLVVYVSTRNIKVQLGEKGLSTGNHSLTSTCLAILTHKKLIFMLLVISLTALFPPILTKGIIYFSKYKLDSDLSAGELLTFVTVGQMVSLPFWTKLSRIMSKVIALKASHLLLTASTLGILYLGDSAYFICFLCASSGFALGAIYMMIWSILADIIDEHHEKKGLRLEASIFAIAIMLMKISLGAGSAILGASMGFIGYEGNTQPTAQVLANLEYVYFGLPALGGLLCFAFLRRVEEKPLKL